MKAIKIDVVKQEVHEVEFPGGLKSVYQTIDCSVIDVVPVPNTEVRHSIYVDDEGLLKDPIGYFTYNGNGPYAGHGLLVGTDGNGDDISATIPVDVVRRNVHFIRADEIQKPDPHPAVISLTDQEKIDVIEDLVLGRDLSDAFKIATNKAGDFGYGKGPRWGGKQ